MHRADSLQWVPLPGFDGLVLCARNSPNKKTRYVSTRSNTHYIAHVQ